jgi:hypothetical protein
MGLPIMPINPYSAFQYNPGLGGALEKVKSFSPGKASTAVTKDKMGGSDNPYTPNQSFDGRNGYKANNKK